MTKDLLSIIKHELHEEYIVSYLGKELGDISLDVDGFWYFYPTNTDGCWSDWMLFEILTKMRKLNVKWDLYLQTDPKC